MGYVERRSSVTGRLTEEVLDLLVIGGGIVGAGVARDAAMRGMRVGLVDRQDFASGTSSRSSRLLHGGLRYLAQGRVGMVREAGREKRVLARVAPHLVRPLRFVFPTYRDTPWPRWKLAAGVWIYDMLCGTNDGLRSGVLAPDAIKRELPGIADTGLTGGVFYGDALTNDARLVIDTLRSAERHGAMLLNYAQIGKVHQQGDPWRATIVDNVRPQRADLRARVILNAAGPWADRFAQSGVKLRLTKGIHLVIDRGRLPVNDAVALSEGTRILFVLPFGQRIILGTTDTDYTGDPAAVKTDAEDVAYVLGVVNRAFPAANLSADDVIADWAGIRPLIADPHGRASDISRRHLIIQRGTWIDVAGGKLTTYRNIAEEAVDHVEHALGKRFARCRTADEELVAAEDARGISTIEPPPLSRELVHYYSHHEWAITPEDITARRGRWDSYCPDAREIRARVREWMAGAG